MAASGAKRTFGGIFSVASTPVEEVVKCTPPEETVKTQNVTSHDSDTDSDSGLGVEEFITTLQNSGKLSGTLNYKAAAGQEALRTCKGTLTAFTLAFPAGVTLGFNGNLTRWKWGQLDVDGVQQCDFEVELSGPLTVTPAGS